MKPVRLCALGTLRLITDQRITAITSPAPALLLGYLICHAANGQPIARSRLAGSLWPDVTEARARRNLTDTLYRLRRAIGVAIADRMLRSDDDMIALSDVTIDVAEFRRLAASAQAADWQTALNLYTGDLLDDLDADWLLAPREHLHEVFLTTLERVCVADVESGHLSKALTVAQLWVESDPLSEAAHATAMRLYARLGRYADALRQYDRLAQLLDQELKIEPLPETRALAAALRSEIELARRVTAPVPALPFVGRAGERALLLEAVEATIAGRGGVIAIEGAAGIGKSRLLDEIAAGAKWRGVTVVTGRAGEYPSASSLAPLAEVVASALGGSRLAQVEMLLPDETLAALAPLVERWRDRAALPDLPPLPARQRFHQALSDVLQTLASIAPHVIVIDDAHWATPSVWEALDAVAPLLTQLRVLIVVAYRRASLESTSGWNALQQWERDGRLKVLTLSPLNRAEITQLLPSDRNDMAVEVLALTGGNPFYVMQTLITLNEGGVLDKQPVLTRAAALPATAQTALAAASILGDKIPFREWAATCELPPAELAAATEQLIVHGFLQIDESGYVFAHDLIQAMSYDQIDPGQRQQLHRRAAQAAREFDPANAHGLAFHLDRAGEFEEAARCYRTAGAQDLARFAFAEAQTAFERALQLSPPASTPERIETLFDLAQIGDSTGDRARQAAALHAALRDAEQLEDDGYVIRARLGLGRLSAVTGEVDAAEQYLNAALTLAEHHSDRALQFDASFYSGDLAARRGRLAEARTCFEQARQHAHALGDSRREARALRGLGIAARLSGDLPQSLTLTEQALALQKTAGDQFGASVTMTNLLATLYELGAYDRLLALADESLALKEKLGDRHGAAIVRHQHGLAAYALGDFDLARQRLIVALQDFEAVQDRRSAGLARNVLGLVAESEDCLEEARQDFEAALASAEAVSATSEAAYAQHDLGALLLRLNDPQTAMQSLEAARAKWRDLGNDLLRYKSEAYLGLALLATGDRSAVRELAEENWQAFQRGGLGGEQPQAWLWALQQLLKQLGQHEQAIAVLRAAYAELQRQGEAITASHLRQQFFNRVPLNRAIVEAYDHLNQLQRRLSVTLVRIDVPLGRRLTDRDYVTIEWTIAAPEDDALTDPIDRRRHILSRLIAEARSANAAPTDDDLARALDVSRRTILRDIAALSRSGVILPTRRRK
jgi:DNA-binding SARP family transcriptional activator